MERHGVSKKELEENQNVRVTVHERGVTLLHIGKKGSW